MGRTRCGTRSTWAIEDGQIPLAQLAVIMGTSIREFEDTYHRWLRRTDDQLRAPLADYGLAMSR